MSKTKTKSIEQHSAESPAVKLRACDLQQCKARCCYDGVYLQAGEEKKIREVVASAPEYFDNLPADFIVDGVWDNQPAARKTAIKSFESNGPDFPAHFSRTRCVFCGDDYKCMLQVLAVQRGLHKWRYKPEACWLFPLRTAGDQLVPPPTIDEPDPDALEEGYPGYSKYVPCGQDRADGLPWQEALAEEVGKWKE